MVRTMAYFLRLLAYGAIGAAVLTLAVVAVAAAAVLIVYGLTTVAA